MVHGCDPPKGLQDRLASVPQTVGSLIRTPEKEKLACKKGLSIAPDHADPGQF